MTAHTAKTLNPSNTIQTLIFFIDASDLAPTAFRLSSTNSANGIAWLPQ